LKTEYVGVDIITLSWNRSGDFSLYYNTENNPDKANRFRVSGTAVTLNNLAYNLTYYFWIEPVFDSVKSQVLRVPLIETKMLQKGPAGGIVFFDKINTDGGWRYMEAASIDLGPIRWGAYGKRIDGTKTEVGTGEGNTRLLLERLKEWNERDRAAQLAADYDGGGYTDWFLPSIDELNAMYLVLKKKKLGAFKDDLYWSSSEGKNYAWRLNFGNGTRADIMKTDPKYVRPIRMF
jgi:hypothetical protein